jgi:hypothetical protein
VSGIALPTVELRCSSVSLEACIVITGEASVCP